MFDKWTDKDILGQIVIEANQVAIPGESNRLREMVRELETRLDDHAAEIREVLEVLNVFASGNMTDKTWGAYDDLAKKYAHYLEEK